MRPTIYVCITALSLIACNQRKEPQSCVPLLPGWATAETKSGDIFVSNTVRLAEREIRWNGKRIDEPTLTRFVRQLAPSTPVPYLIFDPGPSPDCAFATHVRDVLDRNYPCREAACGQGPASDFVPR